MLRSATFVDGRTSEITCHLLPETNRFIAMQKSFPPLFFERSAIDAAADLVGCGFPEVRSLGCRRCVRYVWKHPLF